MSKVYKPKGAPEKKLEAWFAGEIEKLGGECLKLEVAGRRGWMDRLCIMPHAVTAYVEVKAKRGRLSKTQKVKGDFLKKHDHIYGVIWDRKGGKAMLAYIEIEMRLNEVLRNERERLLERSLGSSDA